MIARHLRPRTSLQLHLLRRLTVAVVAIAPILRRAHDHRHEGREPPLQVVGALANCFSQLSPPSQPGMTISMHEGRPTVGTATIIETSNALTRHDREQARPDCGGTA